MKRSNYSIIKNDPKQSLYIKDIGPWDLYLSVTNDAEQVIQELVELGQLPTGRRLYCIDSMNIMGELLIKDGKFAGFA